jgi:hypothetical protein
VAETLKTPLRKRKRKRKSLLDVLTYDRKISIIIFISPINSKDKETQIELSNFV